MGRFASGSIRGAAFIVWLGVCLVGCVDVEGKKPVVIPFRQVVIDGAGPTDMHVKSAGDINGDGLVDLIVAGTAGPVIWYEAPRWDRHVVTEQGGWSTDAETADMDRDGDLDIVISDWYKAKRLVWFENFHGRGRVWRMHPIGDIRAHDIEAADLDGDKDIDLVTRQQGEAGASIEIWLQQSPWRWEHLRVECPAGEGLDLGDIDGDGDADIVIGAFWYETPDDVDTGQWIERRYTHQWTHPACVVAVADINGDGRMDITLAPSEPKGERYRIVWYKAPTEPKSATWAEHVITPDVETVVHSLAVGDVDGDGAADVVTAEMHQGADPDEVTVHINRGGGLLWRSVVFSDRGSHACRLLDVGADGDLDIFGANWAETRRVDLWENRTAPDIRRLGPFPLSKWTYIHVDGDRAGRAFGLATADFTGDGYLDIVSGRYFHRNPGGDMTAPWRRSELPVEGDALLTMDVDSDMLPDVIAMDPAGRVYWLEPTGNDAMAWNIVEIGEVGEANHELSSQGYATAQLEPGGRDEVILNVNGLHYFIVPARPTRGPWKKVTIANAVYGEGVATADIDEDGDIDVCGTSDGLQVVWWANPGDGSANWPVNIVGTMPAKYADRFGAADIDGDGHVDIVVSAANGKGNGIFWWSQSPGADRIVWTRNLVSRQDSTNSMDVRDLDRDGDVDIVAGEHRGVLKTSVWENDGEGQFVEHVVAVGIESHLGTRTADLDGDGDYDIVSIAWDKSEDLHVWRNDARTAGGVKNVFVLFDEEVVHTGDNRLYEDWDFQLGKKFEPRVPLNWLDPIHYAGGDYRIRCDIIEMNPVAKPVQIGFGWTNRPRIEDATIQHRANRPLDVTGKGLYFATVAVTDDWHGPGYKSDPTKPWLWDKAYSSGSFFTFIRPNGQNPFPMRFRLQVLVASARPADDPENVVSTFEAVKTGRRIKDAVRNSGVTIRPVLVEGAVSEADSVMEIRNGSKETMNFVGSFAKHPQLSVEPRVVRRSVAAGETARVELKVKAAQPVPADSAGAVLMNWSASFRTAGLADIRTSGLEKIRLEPIVPVVRAMLGRTIDGDLAEWDDLPLAVEAVGEEFRPFWKGPADASFRFAVSHDKKDLYLAVRVRDQQRSVVAGKQYYLGDAVQVWLGEAGGPAKPVERVIVGVRADGTVAEAPSSATIAAATLPDGYTLEMRIPLAELPIGKEPPRRFRLNLAQYDKDETGQIQLWFRENWTTPRSYPDSGTFELE